MPSMPPEVFVAVLVAALFHAAWNALIRGSSDQLMQTASIALLAGVLCLPLLVLLPMPSAESWPFMLGSVTVHMVYYTSLAAAYRYTELSVAYPLIRGLAPLVVALCSAWAFGERLGGGTAFGVLLISAGVMCVALRRRMERRHVRGLSWAVLCAATIAAYTMFDGAGARVSGHVPAYLAWKLVLDALLFSAGIILFKGYAPLLHHVTVHWRTAALAAGLSALAYGIALWGMTRAPVAAVAALRETSVLFAVMIGWLFMRERVRALQWTGVLAIILGAVLLRG